MVQRRKEAQERARIAESAAASAVLMARYPDEAALQVEREALVQGGRGHGRSTQAHPGIAGRAQAH